jgi:hypothetical protein
MTELVVFCVLLVALAAFVAFPLYEPPYGRHPAPTQAPAADGHEHDAVDRALADLEIDRASGLLGPDDYERERAALGAASGPPAEAADPMND